jgi:hypothetical protein
MDRLFAAQTLSRKIGYKSDSSDYSSDDEEARRLPLKPIKKKIFDVDVKKKQAEYEAALKAARAKKAEEAKKIQKELEEEDEAFKKQRRRQDAKRVD